MNVKENVFLSSEREFKKALRDTFMQAAWYESEGMVPQKKAGTPKLNHKAELEAPPQKGREENTTKN